MIAGAFAYFNYKFSEYKFINFGEWIFYEKRDLFVPDEERYLVVFYSSNMQAHLDMLQEAQSEYPILAVDYYQQSFDAHDRVRYLKAGTNTLLSFIQRFNIYHAPSVFIIKKVKDTLYKQDSMIRKLDTNKLNLKGL